MDVLSTDLIPSVNEIVPDLGNLLDNRLFFLIYVDENDGISAKNSSLWNYIKRMVVSDRKCTNEVDFVYGALGILDANIPDRLELKKAMEELGKEFQKRAIFTVYRDDAPQNTKFDTLKELYSDRGFADGITVIGKVDATVFGEFNQDVTFSYESEEIEPMEYSSIPKRVRKYIRKSTYIGMTPDEQCMYLMSATGMMYELDKSADEIKESLRELNISEPREPRGKLNFRNVKFVGMRFFDDHVFKPSDEIKLVIDNSASYGLKCGSIKVMLRKSKKFKQVAYVERGDATWLRTVKGFEELPLEFMDIGFGKASYSIDLRPLEDKGVKLLSKAAVLGKHVNSYYMYDELWHNYPDLDYTWTLPGFEDS
ncbi:hypothetical protein BGZ91_000686 [Linnemannia elongata]|nr:hypothetical protein BGZ91_000686 [Linnemannia elongata]